jgi:hypothetical protein
LVNKPRNQEAEHLCATKRQKHGNQGPAKVEKEAWAPTAIKSKGSKCETAHLGSNCALAYGRAVINVHPCCIRAATLEIEVLDAHQYTLSEKYVGSKS